jgi:general stress protein 26
MNSMKQEENKNVEKLIEMVKDVRICMLITNEKNTENLSGRPMSISKIDDDGTMWFFTKASSYKVDEIEESKNVSLAITNESSNNYLMIHGTATLVNDKNKMKELWSSILKAWFPLGLDDPDMTLIKVTPKEVNYWDSSSSKMVVLFNMLKAIVTGKEYQEGEHGKINL